MGQIAMKSGKLESFPVRRGPHTHLPKLIGKSGVEESRPNTVNKGKSEDRKGFGFSDETAKRAARGLTVLWPAFRNETNLH